MTVRVVDQTGNPLGIMSVPEALELARSRSLDLVEIAPQSKPPVCKILNYGKFKYEEQKKKNEARKKQKIVALKEVKMRPNIDEHDYQVKLRNVQKFLTAGDKVKVTLMFRRRELDHKDIGQQVIQRLQKDIEDIAKIDNIPKLERNHMIMVVSPKA